MDEPVKTRRYDSTRRAERARANREAVLRAAHRLFVEQGYGATAIAAIAREAGVSGDLVYKVFGSKQRLLMEVLNFVVIQDAQARTLMDQPGPQAVRAETDQRRQLALLVDDITASTLRTRSLDDVFARAADTDPEIADRHRRAHRTRLRNLTTAVGWLTANGPLAVPEDEAAATLWNLTGPASHRQMVDGLGWDDAAWRSWVHRTVAAALLPAAD